MQLSPLAAIVLGLLLAAWTFVAAAMMLAARSRERQARSARTAARRFSRMIENSPAIPLLVRGDGALEGPARLAGWLGFETLPRFLSELRGEDGAQSGMLEAELEQLRQEVRRTLKTAAPFRMEVTPLGSRRSLVLCGQFADRMIAPEGAALVWWFDHTETDDELARLRQEANGLRGDFAAVMQLIEAAPLPMWFRGPDLALRLVNRAYVAAVGGSDAAAVLRDQVELVEAVEGREPADIAADAQVSGQPATRTVRATISGQRRSLRVHDLPLGAAARGQGEGEGEGVAGFAVDIEEREAHARAMAALGEAQRALIARLSVGVALFDFHRRLAFANLPFRRLFALPEQLVDVPELLDFPRFLDRAREAGRVPESGDFPAWRKALGEWFGAEEPVEQAWALADGSHLRIVAVPMPDGGLVLLAEDRSQHLALTASREAILRRLAVTLDAVNEVIVVFTPEGQVDAWNHPFAELIGVAGERLSAHPRAEAVLAAINQLLDPEEPGVQLGEAIRAATLERHASSGRLRLAAGRELDFAAVPLPDGNGLLVLRDISGAEAAASVQRQSDAALATVQAERSAFLAELAGKLRSGLLAIGGSAEALREGVPGDHLAAILDATADLETRVEDVVDQAAGRVEAAPPALARVELLGLVTAVVRGREAAIEAKDLTLNLKGVRHTDTIMADERQMAQALGALVDEAIAAAPRGGRIDVNLSRLRSEARIEIVGDLKPVSEGWAGETGSTGRTPGGDVRRVRRVVEAHGGRLQNRTGSAANGTPTRIATITLP